MTDALFSEADVFVCNLRDKALVKLGLDYDALAAKYPSLIWAQLRGYGEFGEEANTPFKPEMMCIVDALDAGTLVFRNEHFDFVLPNSRIAHWLKRAYERHYLTTYR